MIQPANFSPYSQWGSYLPHKTNKNDIDKMKDRICSINTDVGCSLGVRVSEKYMLCSGHGVVSGN